MKSPGGHVKAAVVVVTFGLKHISAKALLVTWGAGDNSVLLPSSTVLPGEAPNPPDKYVVSFSRLSNNSADGRNAETGSLDYDISENFTKEKIYL